MIKKTEFPAFKRSGGDILVTKSNLTVKPNKGLKEVRKGLLPTIPVALGYRKVGQLIKCC